MGLSCECYFDATTDDYDRHLKWLRDLATYANYLETCKWPDRME